MIVAHDDPRLRSHRASFAESLNRRVISAGEDTGFELPSRADLDAITSAAPGLHLPEDYLTKRSVLNASGYPVVTSLEDLEVRHHRLKTVEDALAVGEFVHGTALSAAEFVLALVSDPVIVECERCSWMPLRERPRHCACGGWEEVMRWASAYLVVDSDDWYWLTVVGHTGRMSNIRPDYSGNCMDVRVHARCDQLAGLSEAMSSDQVKGVLLKYAGH